MGGALTVAIRRLNGTEYISERWTNPFPDWLACPEFWSDGEVVDEYIKSGLDAFTPVDRVFPSTYGITLIDFQTKKVFSRQDYCGIWQRVCVFINSKGAKDLLGLIERGWVTRYQVSRHSKHDSSEEERKKLREDEDLHPDEVKAFHKHLETLAAGPPEDNGTIGSKHFEAGMVVMHWKVPGWTLDDGTVHGCAAGWKVWPEVVAFVKEAGWKSPCWTQTEVDREFGDEQPKAEARP